MKILIVHDREMIREEIVRIVKAENSENDVEVRATYNEARDILRESDGNYFDLMILDLTLPIDSHDQRLPTVENVQSLLRELCEGNELIAPGDIIGISNDLPAVESAERQFAEQLLTLLKESDDSDWKLRLTAKLQYIRKAIVARLSAEVSEYGTDVLIITALDKEAEPYADLFELGDMETAYEIKRFVFTDKKGVSKDGILFSVGRSGQAPTASATQTLLTRFRPRLALMSGFCGGMRGKVELRDVIAFNSSYAWDQGKWVYDNCGGEPLFKARPYPIDSHDGPLTRVIRDLLVSDFLQQPGLVSRMAELSSTTDILPAKLHSKPAGSGSAVVSEKFIADSIRNLNDDIWAVDMESYGFYYACKYTKAVKPHYLCIKSVSDFCDPKKNDELHASCSYLSAQTVKTIITSYVDF